MKSEPRSLTGLIRDVDGFDPDSVPVSTAASLIAALCEPVEETLSCPIDQALDRILGEDLISPIDVPAHDNSAMDGYSFSYADLRAQGETVFEVVGEALAGRPSGQQPGPGQAIRIMTGAMMPPGHDTVIAQEICRVEGSQVRVPAGQASGQNRRLRGEDLGCGQPALRAGIRIGPAELGLIASLGLSEVRVRRRVKVAFFSTGDELQAVGKPLEKGQIYDSNRYTLAGMLRRLDAELIDLGVVPDRPDALEHTMREAAERADLVISSAGVSVGDADFTRAVLSRLGEVAFWTIAMRPGRPLAFGRIGRALYFGLPGNPVAVMVTFLFLVREALLRRAGATIQPLPVIRALAATRIAKRAGRTEYQRGRLSMGDDGRASVALTGSQGSGMLSSMSEADCIIVMPADQAGCTVGDPVSCVPLACLLHP
jgi:molybdopterin molybdotransferase